MSDKIYIHWDGPGYYAVTRIGDIAYRIHAPSMSEAEGIARMAGLDPKKVTHLSRKPEKGHIVEVIDETKE